MRSSIIVLIAFLGGLATGSVVGDGTVLRFIEPVGTLWINAIRMPIIPLLMALVISGVAGTRDTRAVGRLTARAVVTFLIFLTVVTAISTLVAPIALSGITIDPASTAALQASVPQAVAVPPPLSIADWVTGLVPTNPIRAAADGALLPLVIFALLYGLALTRIEESRRQAQLSFFHGVADTLIVIIRWVLALAPIGIFALAFALGARVGAPAAGAVAWYLLVTSLAVLVVIIALYAIMMIAGRVPPRTLFAALLPAQVIALSSRSSLAALPALIDGVRGTLKLPDNVTAVVLPLAASIFKINAAVTWSFGAVFIATLYGVQLDPGEMAMFAAATVLLSLATPGIPSGGFFVQAPLYVAVGLPVEGIGILIAVDLILDMFKTASNVTGFATVAVVVAWREKGVAHATP